MGERVWWVGTGMHGTTSGASVESGQICLTQRAGTRLSAVWSDGKKGSLNQGWWPTGPRPRPPSALPNLLPSLLCGPEWAT